MSDQTTPPSAVEPVAVAAVAAVAVVTTSPDAAAVPAPAPVPVAVAVAAPTPGSATLTMTTTQPGQAPATVVATLQAATEATKAATGLLGVLSGMPFLKAVGLLITMAVGGAVYSNGGRIADAMAKAVESFANARTERTHATALQDSLVRSRQTAAVLAGVRESLSSSRASSFEFHNGTNNLRGMPFLFLSQTGESVAPGVSSELSAHQRMPLAVVLEWLPKFLAGECVTVDAGRLTEPTQDDAAPMLHDAMARVGADFAYACPVFVPESAGGRTREPAAFVSASYTKGWAHPSESQAHARLRDAASMMGVTLRAYLDSKR